MVWIQTWSGQAAASEQPNIKVICSGMTGSSSWKHCVENAIPRQCPSQLGRRQTKAANTKASEKPFWAGVNFYWCNDIGGVRLVQMLWFWRCLQLEIERIASRCHWRRHPPHSTHTHTHTHHHHHTPFSLFTLRLHSVYSTILSIGLSKRGGTSRLKMTLE